MARRRALLALAILLAPAIVPTGAGQTDLELSDPVETTALAVALTRDGTLVGAEASISVSVATNGSGHVYIDTRPLAGTDMQGSARIAARVAASLTGYPLEQHDFFFVVRSDTPIVSGPSAGSLMALATVVALHNTHRSAGEEPWTLDERVMGTGTISPDGTVGPVGGILEKAQAAKRHGAELFFVPEGQGLYTPRLPQEQEKLGEGPIDVERYCREEIGITCQEVGGIEQLVRLATGHAFVQPDLGEPPSTARYEQSLGPLSTELIDRGTLYEDQWDRLNASEIPAESREMVRASIDRAHRFLQQAREHRESQEFYSAASRAFSAAIHGRHAKLLLDFFEDGRRLGAIETAIESAREKVRAAETAAGSANATGLHTLYTVGAAQQRVSDAESRITSAERNLNGSNGPQALFDVAWAVERAATVHWWLSLSEPFGAGPPLPTGIATLADDFLDLADEMLAYSTSVTRSRSGAQAATSSLESAKRDAARGFHAAALLQAAEAQVQAALILEIQAGGPTDEQLNASREQAAHAIQQARGRGVEPILPIAMFEFAGAQEEGIAALEFYRTARVLAGLSSVLVTDPEPTATREVGPWEAPHADASALPDTYMPFAIGWFVVGVFAASALVVLVAAIGRED